MKTIHIKTLSLIILLLSFGKMNAQNDLLASNTGLAPINATDLLPSEEKLIISDFKKASDNQVNKPVITVRSESSTTMQIRIFTLNGELAKEEARVLENGEQDLNVDMSELSQGVYMVQFFTKEGSALRRFIKNN